MTRNPMYRLLCTLVPTCLALVACGGGGDSTGAANTPYVAARSASFSPTTAKDKATNGQDVALHWVYTVNNGQPVMANLLGLSIGVTVSPIEMTLDPANLQRRVTLQGPVSGVANGTAFGGTFSATIAEDLSVSAGKTLFNAQSAEVNVSLTGGGESATGKLNANVRNFSPAYEWFPARETLDQLPIGHVETITSNGTVDLNITVTDVPPIVKSNQPNSISERWTVLEKLPVMVVQGKSYSNIVRLSRQTRVPDFSGNLTTVTMYYWVAKGVGMIKGQGIFRILNIDDVVYELTETNLSQQ